MSSRINNPAYIEYIAVNEIWRDFTKLIVYKIVILEYNGKQGNLMCSSKVQVFLRRPQKFVAIFLLVLTLQKTKQ